MGVIRSGGLWSSGALHGGRHHRSIDHGLQCLSVRCRDLSEHAMQTHRRDMRVHVPPHVFSWVPVVCKRGELADGCCCSHLHLDQASVRFACVDDNMLALCSRYYSRSALSLHHVRCFVATLSNVMLKARWLGRMWCCSIMVRAGHPYCFPISRLFMFAFHLEYGNVVMVSFYARVDCLQLHIQRIGQFISATPLHMLPICVESFFSP